MTSHYTNRPVDCLAEVDLSKLANKTVVITGGKHNELRTLLIYVASFAKSNLSHRQAAVVWDWPMSMLSRTLGKYDLYF